MGIRKRTGSGHVSPALRNTFGRCYRAARAAKIKPHEHAYLSLALSAYGGQCADTACSVRAGRRFKYRHPTALVCVLLALTLGHDAAGQSAVVQTLGDFVAAAQNTSVLQFLVQTDVQLAGASILISRPGQSVSVVGNCSLGRCPLLDGAALSRILTVEAAQLTVSGIQFARGTAAAPADGQGGCLAATANASVLLDSCTFVGCTSYGVRTRRVFPVWAALWRLMLGHFIAFHGLRARLHV